MEAETEPYERHLEVLMCSYCSRWAGSWRLARGRSSLNSGVVAFQPHYIGIEIRFYMPYQEI